MTLPTVSQTRAPSTLEPPRPPHERPRPDPRIGPLRLALAAAAALLVVPVAEATVGDWLRDALLIDFRTSGAGSIPAFEDDPAESAAFFARRDTVAFVLREATTVSDLLALYHLSTSEAARAALREQHGALEDEDLIPAGARVVLPLTAARREP